MANTAQARKRARQAEKHRQLNTSQRSELRTSIKKVQKALAGGDAATAQAAYKDAVPRIAAAVCPTAPAWFSRATTTARPTTEP